MVSACAQTKIFKIHKEQDMTFIWKNNQKAVDKETQMLDNFCCLLFETGFLCVALTVLELTKMLSQVLKPYDNVLGHVLNKHVYVCEYY